MQKYRIYTVHIYTIKIFALNIHTYTWNKQKEKRDQTYRYVVSTKENNRTGNYSRAGYKNGPVCWPHLNFLVWLTYLK